MFEIRKKICVECKQEKPLYEFLSAKNTFDGLKSICKACEAIYNKEYRKKNFGKSDVSANFKFGNCGVLK